jgi:haloalkane dehalogenase
MGFAGMALVRTNEERFEELPDFPYEPSYVSVGEPQMAYVDVGDGEETFLCLHGVPTWSFLYRKMIPTLRERGRVVAPDLVGFGRSDKYTERDEYTFDLIYETLASFIRERDLENITLVCQDWGGILGLCAVGEMPDRFARLVLMNFGAFSRLEAIRRGEADEEETYGPFSEWQEYARTVPELPIAEVVNTGPAMDNTKFTSDLNEAIRAAYEAPFPDEESKAGARELPQLVPTDVTMDGADRMMETLDVLAEWEQPAFVLFSDSDPITRGGRDFFWDFIPTADEQPDIWIEDAGHYLQEDKGPEVADHIVDFIDRTSDR